MLNPNIIYYSLAEYEMDKITHNVKKFIIKNESFLGPLRIKNKKFIFNYCYDNLILYSQFSSIEKTYMITNFNNNNFNDTLENRNLYETIFKKIIKFLIKDLNSLFTFLILWHDINNISITTNELINKDKKMLNYINQKHINYIYKINKSIYNYDFSINKDNHIYNSYINYCAAYIGQITKIDYGNAWLAHNHYSNNIIYSVFHNNFENIKIKILNLFEKINEKPYLNFNESIKELLLTIKPRNNIYSLLKPGYIVGLFYLNSLYFQEAFFESVINKPTYIRTTNITTLLSISNKYNIDINLLEKYNMLEKKNIIGYNKRILINPNKKFYDTDPLVVTYDNKLWDESMLLKKKNFKFSDKINSKNCNAFTTHLGIVYKIINGKPIILHNVKGKIYLSPLDILEKFQILWVMSI